MENTINYIEKLLDGAEVEWKPLGEVAIIGTGSHDTKDAIDDGDYTFYARGRVPLNLNTYDFDETAIITAGDGVGVGKVFHWTEGKYALHQRAYRIVPNNKVNARYIYHYIIANFYAYVTKTSVHSSVSSLRKPMFLKFPVPIPCPEDSKKSLKIQEEIVRILDTFTEHTAELTAELTARKKQYSYYRDELLSFKPQMNADKHGFDVEWKTLGEVVTLKRGKRLVKKQLEETGEYAVYQNAMTPLGYYTESNVKAYTTFVICAGAAGEIGFSDVDFWAADDVHYYLPSDELNDKFIYYFLKTQQHKISSQVRRASIPRLSKSVLEKLKIPLPPLAEQERIVSILDKFDTLTTSISEGLPKEIELRQKQYEYYRDKLLTFPKPTTDAHR